MLIEKNYLDFFHKTVKTKVVYSESEIGNF